MPDRAGQAMWVFAYGSLMWRPGFPVAECRPARLHGLHRDLCVVSHVHRGTPDNPGLVAGLDLGGSCRGIALRVEPGQERDTLAYLRQREQPTKVYRETVRAVDLIPGGAVPAWARERGSDDDTEHDPLATTQHRIRSLCYVADRDHHQYADGLSLQTKAEYVCAGIGVSGHSRDYLDELIASLRSLGIVDAGLIRLRNTADQILSASERPVGRPGGPPAKSDSV